MSPPHRLIRPPTITVAANNGEIGGGEVMLHALVKAMTDLDVPARVVAPEGSPIALTMAAQGYDVIGLAGEGRGGWLRALRRWDARERTGALWCNGLAPALATAGRAGRVVHVHRLPDGRKAWAARVATWGSDAVVVPSDWLAGHLPGAVVLPNWTADVTGRSRQPLVPDHPRIGYLGRLAPEKGIEVLVEAVHPFVQTGARLVVGGASVFADAGEDAAIRRALGGLGTSVELLGWVSPAELLSQVDVLVCPSTFPEAFGLTAAEAMAAGVPLVVSDAGALPEVVGPDHPWVVPAGDARALAQMITTVLSLDSDQRAAVTAAGRERWERLYSPEAGRDRVRRLLEDLGLHPT